MLFDTTLRRDLARTFGATLVVLLTIVITMLLVRTLSLAASDIVEPRDVVLVLGYTALGHLPTILSLSLFVSIVVTLGRMYRDSEMAIWFASGLDLARFVRPVRLHLLAGAGGGRAAAGLRLALGQQQQRRAARPLRAALGPVARGARRVPELVATAAACSSSSATRATTSACATSSFCRARTIPKAWSSAHSGRIDVEGDDRFLVLESGQRNDVNTSTGETTLAGFETYRALVDIRALRRVQELPPKTMATAELMRDAHAAQPGRAGLALRPAARRP